MTTTAVKSNQAQHYDLNTSQHYATITTSNTFDSYGNVTNSTRTNSDAYGNYRVDTRVVYTPDEYNWWLTRYSSQTKTYHAVTGHQATTPAHGTNVTHTATTSIPSWHSSRQPSTTVTPDGVTTHIDYNSYGLPSKQRQIGTIKSGRSNTNAEQTRETRFSYTNNGIYSSSSGYLPYSVTQENGSYDIVTITKYDMAYGVVTETTSPTGVVTRVSYDAFARPHERRISGTPLMHLRYYQPDSDAPSHASYQMVEKAQGAPLTKTYLNKHGKVLRKAQQGFDGSFIFEDVEYDKLGFKTRESRPYYGQNSGQVYTEYLYYDALGRYTEKRSPQANGSNLNTRYTYNKLTTSIDAGGLLMSRIYNSQQALVSTTDAKQGETHYAYNGAGQPIAIKDANNNVISAYYDNVGRKLWVNDPNQGRTNFIYNDFGELERETDANNDSTSYDYDVLGRVTSRFDYGGINGSTAKGNVDARFVWDTVKRGLLSYESGLGHKREYGYDQYGRVTTEKVIFNQKSYITTTEYDAGFGRVKAMTYPNGLTLAYDYNRYGYLSKEKNANSGYVYRNITRQDAFGNITGAQLTDGVLQGTYGYDVATGQMNISQVKRGSQTRQHLTYSYDGFSNVSMQSNWVHNSSEEFAYDDLHRLDYSTRRYSGLSQTIDYSYDAVGNLTKKSDYANQYFYSGSKPNAVSSVTKLNGSRAYFSYDNKGHLIQGDGRTLKYNVQNKPVHIQQGGNYSRLYYDAAGMRYQQFSQSNQGLRTTYYIGKHYEIEIVGGKTSTKAYLGDYAIIKEEGENHTIRFTHRDRLGSASTMTDHNGQATTYRHFDPFGKPLGGNWSSLANARLSANPLDRELITYKGFTDHEHLDDVTLIHMNGRVYDYNLGRFLSVDPLIQGVGNSQGINPYSYILNNPLSGTDPTGYAVEQKTKVYREKRSGSRLPGRSSTVRATTITNDETGEVTSKSTETINSDGSYVVTNTNYSNGKASTVHIAEGNYKTSSSSSTTVDIMSQEAISQNPSNSMSQQNSRATSLIDSDGSVYSARIRQISAVTPEGAWGLIQGAQNSGEGYFAWANAGGGKSASNHPLVMVGGTLGGEYLAARAFAYIANVYSKLGVIRRQVSNSNTYIRPNGARYSEVSDTRLIVSENHLGHITKAFKMHNGNLNLFRKDFWQHVLPHRHIYNASQAPARKENIRKAFQKAGANHTTVWPWE